MDDTIGGEFSGTFDGHGHTITLSISKAGQNNAGLFENLTGTVKYLITAGSLTNGAWNTGAIAAYGSGTIIKCWNQADVSGGNSEGSSGIIGFGNGFQIEDCLNTGAITGNSRVGGITCVNPNCTGNAVRCFSTQCAENGQHPYYLVSGDRACGKIVVTDCYYAGSVDRPGDCSSPSSTKLSGDQITNTASYSGWDFENTWIMTDDGPRLRMPVDGPAVMSAPAANTLTYTGSEQALVSAGTAANGTMKYAVTSSGSIQPESNAYTDTVPAKIGAGTYYVWYRVEGTDAAVTEAAYVEVKIAKTAPTAAAPGGLTAEYGQTLADVSLADKNPAGNTAGSWTWADASASVGNVGTNSFKATFTPEDTTNYTTVENIDVQVTVSKKTANITAPEGSNLEVSVSVSADENGVTVNGVDEEKLEAIAQSEDKTMIIDLSDIPSNTFEIPKETGEKIYSKLGTDGSVSAWMREESSGTEAWYGFDLSANIVAKGIKIGVNSLSIDGSSTLNLLQKQAIKELGKPENMQIYDLKAALGGKEIHDLGGETIKCWPSTDISFTEENTSAYCIDDNGKKESIELSFDTKTAPLKLSGTAGGGNSIIRLGSPSLLLRHFSVYVLVRKDDSTVTKTPAALDPAYNGSPQQLISAGTVEGGTMMYALGTDDTTAPTEGWSETVPAGVNAGTYYVWYKVAGDDTHADKKPVCIRATVAAAPQPSVPIVIIPGPVEAEPEATPTPEATETPGPDAAEITATPEPTQTPDEPEITAAPAQDDPEAADAVLYEDVVTEKGSIRDITGTKEATAESNPYEAKLVNGFELGSLLRISETEAAEGVNVWLDMQDIGDTLSDEEKAKLIEAKHDGYTIGLFLDATLFMKIGDGEPEKVTETNGMLKISLIIPESLRGEGRSYEVIRLHDGVATVIEGIYDEETYTLTFETDRFSSYAVAYREKAAASDEPAGDGDGKEAEILPQTGTRPANKFFGFGFACICYGALVCIAELWRKKINT